MRLLFGFLLINFALSAQIGTGQWRLHVPSSNAIDVVSTSSKIFSAFENGLSEYDIASNEISIWEAVNSLSDINVSCLGNSTSDNSIFIGYENGNIDKIKNNEVFNIPAIKLAEIQGSKTIHKIVEFENYMYLATGFAIVKIDPKKNEVRDTYYPTNGTEAILDIAFRNDTIFAITVDRLYIGDVNNPALADPTQWNVDNRVPILTSNQYDEIENIDGTLFFSLIVDGYGLDTLYEITASGTSIPFIETFQMEIQSINNVENRLAVNYFDGTIIYNSDFSLFMSLNSYNFGTSNPKNITRQNNSYWIADGKFGLVEYKDPSNNNQISFPGPPKNEFYSMDWVDGKLAIAGGGLSQIFVTFSNSGVYFLEDEEWELKDNTNSSLWSNANIWDFLSVSINPKDKDQIAVSTYSEVPLSIINSSIVTDTLTPYNSPIEFTSLNNGWAQISDVKYDADGNLWVLNGYSDKPLKVYTADKQWFSFDLGPTSKNTFTQRMVIDYDGNKWAAIKNKGLFGYNDNGSISNAGDDKFVNLNSGDFTGALPSNEVTAIAVDFDNEIWIGTDNGFAVLYNSGTAFDAGVGGYNAQRIKVEFEGNVEYVLGSTHITDIEVDGANRKWFGTASSGIILLSADGLEILEHHTVENSPLISDAILDLKLDQNTGELFIITDKGLVSYRTDATYEDPDYNNVVVFPNPARPDFDGPITIQGIRYDSDVKITDVAGNLVYETTSNGGTATWDGRTLEGDKVKTGVYLIWTAANEGEGRKVGKVLVVN